MEVKTMVKLTESELKKIVCDYLKLDKETTEITVSTWGKSNKQSVKNNISDQMSDKSVNDSINTR